MLNRPSDWPRRIKFLGLNLMVCLCPVEIAAGVNFLSFQIQHDPSDTISTTIIFQIRLCKAGSYDSHMQSMVIRTVCIRIAGPNQQYDQVKSSNLWVVLNVCESASWIADSGKNECPVERLKNPFIIFMTRNVNQKRTDPFEKECHHPSKNDTCSYKAMGISTEHRPISRPCSTCSRMTRNTRTSPYYYSYHITLTGLITFTGLTLTGQSLSRHRSFSMCPHNIALIFFHVPHYIPTVFQLPTIS